MKSFFSSVAVIPITHAPFMQGMSNNYSYLGRLIHAAFVNGQHNNKGFKRDFCATHNIGSRQFNTISIDVKGKIDSATEYLKLNKIIKQAKFDKVETAIKRLQLDIKSGISTTGSNFRKKTLKKKERQLFNLKRRSDTLLFKLNKAKAGLISLVPPMCFGSKKLYKSQPNDGSDRTE